MASKLERFQPSAQQQQSAVAIDARNAEILRKFAVDDEHKVDRLEHEIAKERQVTGGSRVERKACSCGWRGEWFRIRSTI